jgi:hypothetical protein
MKRRSMGLACGAGAAAALTIGCTSARSTDPAPAAARIEAEPARVVEHAPELLRAAIAATELHGAMQKRREIAKQVWDELQTAYEDDVDDDELARRRRAVADPTLPLLRIEPRGCVLPGVPVGPRLVDETLRPETDRPQEWADCPPLVEYALVEVFALANDRVRVAAWVKNLPNRLPLERQVDLRMVDGAWHVERIYFPPVCTLEGTVAR